MEIEKPLIETNHCDALADGHYFYLASLPTRLVLFQDSIYFSNDKVECTYVITFDFSYDIIRDGNGWELTIFCPEPLKFYSLVDLGSWEQQLIKIMKRKRFHEYYKGIKKIGKGNFASVYLTERIRDGKYVAVKAFQKESTFKPTNGKEGLEN